MFLTKRGEEMKPKAIIFDIDGTLADVEHRRHFVDGSKGKKDFNKFYEAMRDDGVHEDIVELFHLYQYSMKYRMVICTGRPEQYRSVTQDWLCKFGIDCNELLMRPDNRSHEPDYLVKQDMLNDLKLDYDIVLAVDDRDQVVKMWRDNGIRCLQVANGDF